MATRRPNIKSSPKVPHPNQPEPKIIRTPVKTLKEALDVLKGK